MYFYSINTKLGAPTKGENFTNENFQHKISQIKTANPLVATSLTKHKYNLYNHANKYKYNQRTIWSEKGSEGGS